MKWNHLPEAGGLNAQDPELLEGFELIFQERSKHEAEQEAKREREGNKLGNKKGRHRKR